MIKQLRVTVDGKPYDVTVELADEPASSSPPAPVAVQSSAPAPVTAAASPPPPAPSPAPTPAAPASSGPAGSGDVPSPLSGHVVGIVVQVGQEINEHDHLLTVEAMKMNTFVLAPKSGKVAEIKTTVGAVVEEGQVLLRIE